ERFRNFSQQNLRLGNAHGIRGQAGVFEGMELGKLRARQRAKHVTGQELLVTLSIIFAHAHYNSPLNFLKLWRRAIRALRIWVFTVPSGRLSCSLISLWLMSW